MEKGAETHPEASLCYSVTFYHCEGVSNGLCSLASAPLSALHSDSIYFGIFLKNYWPYRYEILTLPRGHRGHQHVEKLGESDEGILGGEGGKIFFDPLYLPYGWSWDPKFLHTLGPLPALMSDT